MTHAPSFRELMSQFLSPAEMQEAIFAFDVLGKLALIEIPKKLQKKKKKIASALMHAVKNVESVYEKVGEHEGKFRLEKVRFIAGKKISSTSYKEWNCDFELMPGKVFFSPRLGTERQRIASYVKKGETVAVFFAGVGPYAVTLAKHAKPARVFAIEWNPDAIPWLEMNVRKNKVQDIVVPIHADVKKVGHILGQCDHVIMPAPESATKYLSEAIKCLSPRGGRIHCYAFVSNKKPLHAMWKKLQLGLKKVKGTAEVEDIRKVLQFSPRKVQMCAVLRVNGSKK